MFPPFLRSRLDDLTGLGLPKAVGPLGKFAQRVTFGFALACASAGAVGAQTPVALESCAPPAKGEYLLLVVVQAEDAEDKLKQTLPPSVKAPACDYLGTRVARMGGFRSPEDADAWASYLRQVASLPAFIAQPPSGESTAVAPQNLPQSAASSPTSQASSKAKVSVPALGSEPPLERPAAPASSTANVAQEAPATPAIPGADSVPKPDLSPRNATTRYPDAAVTVPGPAGSAASTAATTTAQATSTSSNVAKVAFAPKSLASGYAVLVDYGNETAIANQVESALQRPVGLVSYGQRPYLMAEYSADSAIAIATLRNLSRRGFQTILVDSQGVTVLTETVK